VFTSRLGKFRSLAATLAEGVKINDEVTHALAARPSRGSAPDITLDLATKTRWCRGGHVALLSRRQGFAENTSERERAPRSRCGGIDFR